LRFVFSAKVSCGAARIQAPFLLSSGSLAKKAIDYEQHDRADRCNNDAAEIERLDLSQADETACKAAQNGADYADEDRNNNATGIFAGHDKFGKRTGNQAQENPGENTHIREDIAKAAEISSLKEARLLEPVETFEFPKPGSLTQDFGSLFIQMP
jgi:hypothetical protein